MFKFNFSVKNRSGQKVDNIIIGGNDRADAERKLFQMYRQCTVLSCAVKRPEEKIWHAASMEDILTLISK